MVYGGAAPPQPGGGTTNAVQAAGALAELADTLGPDFTPTGHAQRLTKHAVALTGADAAGALLTDDAGRAHLTAATPQSALPLQEWQTTHRAGPGWHTLQTGATTATLSLAEMERRWPGLATLSRLQGHAAACAVPMSWAGSTLGALTLHTHQPAPLATTDMHLAETLACAAALALLQHRRLTRAEDLVARLQTALESRVVIEQAKGILAQRHGTDPDTALIRLRATARSTQQNLTDLARAIIADTPPHH